MSPAQTAITVAFFALWGMAFIASAWLAIRGVWEWAKGRKVPPPAPPAPPRVVALRSPYDREAHEPKLFDYEEHR